mmetsp:Transcript_12576/g.30433  ORF Transcript_12576/g.30433 Transcript_12576/m.30433 type:complete len:201 (+) Transcript_12576:13-615(+)
MNFCINQSYPPIRFNFNLQFNLIDVIHGLSPIQRRGMQSLLLPTRLVIPQVVDWFLSHPGYDHTRNRLMYCPLHLTILLLVSSKIVSMVHVSIGVTSVGNSSDEIVLDHRSFVSSMLVESFQLLLLYCYHLPVAVAASVLSSRLVNSIGHVYRNLLLLLLPQNLPPLEVEVSHLEAVEANRPAEGAGQKTDLQEVALVVR